MLTTNLSKKDLLIFLLKKDKNIESQLDIVQENFFPLIYFIVMFIYYEVYIMSVK